MQCIKNDKKSKTKKKQYSIALFYICNSGHPSTSDGSDEKVISLGQFECAWQKSSIQPVILIVVLLLKKSIWAYQSEYLLFYTKQCVEMMSYDGEVIIREYRLSETERSWCQLLMIESVPACCLSLRKCEHSPLMCNLYDTFFGSHGASHYYFDNIN